MWGTTVRAATTAAPATVWALLADPARWTEWDPALAGVAGQVARGARIRTRTRSGRTAHLKVVLCEPGLAMADRQRLPLARATVTRTVQPAPDGSEVTLEVRFTGIFGRLWWRVVGARVTTGLAAQAKGIVAAAERG